jgi:hypothetical protein
MDGWMDGMNVKIAVARVMGRERESERERKRERATRWGYCVTGREGNGVGFDSLCDEEEKGRRW